MAFILRLAAVSTIDLQPLESSLDGQPRAARGFSISGAMEQGAGLILLGLAAPAIAASAAVVAVLARRSPFIAHLRMGRDGRPFWMLKLRSMWPVEGQGTSREWVEHIVADPEEDGKEANDKRVTSRFAAFCRRHSIDELPQLWHVARGEMSLVGPRPLTRAEIERYYADNAAELLSVKPGLTGLWQIGGRSAIRFPLRATLDLELIRTLNLKTYLKILARTIPAIIFGTGAW